MQLPTLVPEAFFYSFLANFATQTASFIFLLARSAESREKKPLVRTVGILAFMPSAFDCCFCLEDIFNCSTSHITGWIKYLWGCDWLKENDSFDSCQVVSQHETEILNNLGQRLSFLSFSRLGTSFSTSSHKFSK